LARNRLARLAERWPDEAEVALELGRCELARGRPQEALAVWARASGRSHLAGRVALERADLTIRLGRVTQAGRILTPAPDRPAPEPADLPHLLLSLLCHEGRFDEARRLIETEWDDLGRSRPESRDIRLTLLREHIGLDFETLPLEGSLAQIQGRPDDDRLRLA